MNLTVGLLRDLLKDLDPNLEVRIAMNLEYEDAPMAVYQSGDYLYFEDNTSAVGDNVGGSVLFNQYAQKHQTTV